MDLIILAGFLIITALIIWGHFRICKKILFVDYTNPTRGDLLDCQACYGGPLLMIPGVNLIMLVITYLQYYNMTHSSSDERWEDKPLKR